MTHRKRRGFAILELAVLFGISAIFVALLLPAVQQAREAARRTQCKNNLHQIGIAMHNYHDAHRTLPCGWYQPSWEGSEPDAFGWGVSILPFIEQAPLYNQIDTYDRNRPSEQELEVLTALRELRLEVYRCPTDPSPDVNAARGDWGAMSYSANFGHLPPPRWETGTLAGAWPGMCSTPQLSGGLFCCNWGADLFDVIDGLSQTIMVGERGAASTNGLWMGVRGNAFENDAVTDASRFSPLNGGVGTFGSEHVGGAHFLLSDGAVRFVSDDVNLPPEVRSGSLGLGGDPHRDCIMEKLACRNDKMNVGRF
jgi:type II secretory pathway pseudopilin PulG